VLEEDGRVGHAQRESDRARRCRGYAQFDDAGAVPSGGGAQRNELALDRGCTRVRAEHLVGAQAANRPFRLITRSRGNCRLRPAAHQLQIDADIELLLPLRPQRPVPGRRNNELDAPDVLVAQHQGRALEHDAPDGDAAYPSRCQSRELPLRRAAANDHHQCTGTLR